MILIYNLIFKKKVVFSIGCFLQSFSPTAVDLSLNKNHQKPIKTKKHFEVNKNTASISASLPPRAHASHPARSMDVTGRSSIHRSLGSREIKRRRPSFKALDKWKRWAVGGFLLV